MDSPLLVLMRAVAAGHRQRARRLLARTPEIARQALEKGATRQGTAGYFFTEIRHYVYAGDTALHVAAVAYDHETARELIAQGAQVSARNRRGAEPLHYAADGGPGSATWNPAAQQAIIESLIQAGADPNSADKNGVTPLHRAVRTRCAAAVRALLAGGADPRRKNAAGSTALHLAVQNTGRGGSGSAASQDQQKQIIVLLFEHGASPKDRDGQRKTVEQSARSSWVRDFLRAASSSRAAARP